MIAEFHVASSVERREILSVKNESRAWRIGDDRLSDIIQGREAHASTRHFIVSCEIARGSIKRTNGKGDLTCYGYTEFQAVVNTHGSGIEYL